MNVTIEPHVGKKANGQPVVFDQQRIRVDGMVAGYVANRDGSPIMLSTHVYSDEQKQEIQSQVDALKGSASTSITAPVEIPEHLQMSATPDEPVDLDDLDA